MYPTISHLLKDLFGINVPVTISTFSALLVLAILAAYYFLDKELKRKTRAKLLTGSYDSGGAYREPDDQAILIILIALFAGFTGARLFSIIKYSEPFAEAPLQVFFSFDHLSYYGGFIFACAATIFYANYIRLNKFHMLDAATPALVIAYAIGRLGCYLSGNGNWGISNPNPKPDWLFFLPDAMWAHNYPHNLLRAGVSIPGCADDYCTVLPQPVFPTSLYESFIFFAAFLLFWKLKNRISTPGILFAAFLLFTGIERFLIEQIRVDAEFELFSYSVDYAEFISIIFILTGISTLLNSSRKFKERRFR